MQPPVTLVITNGIICISGLFRAAYYCCVENGTQSNEAYNYQHNDNIYQIYMVLYY